MEKFTQSGHRLIAIAGRHLNDDDENAFHSRFVGFYKSDNQIHNRFENTFIILAIQNNTAIKIESHLNLYGVVVLENRLKPASEVTVEQLNDVS